MTGPCYSRDALYHAFAQGNPIDIRQDMLADAESRELVRRLVLARQVTLRAIRETIDPGCTEVAIPDSPDRSNGVCGEKKTDP